MGFGVCKKSNLSGKTNKGIFPFVFNQKYVKAKVFITYFEIFYGN